MMMAGGHVFRFLFLAGFCLQSVFMEQQRVLEQRKPFFERFRRLEEQFRRFQDMTLTRLQGIAENYNISYNIDARFHHISDQQRSLAEAFNASSDMTQQELNGVKFWLKKVQKKTKKLDLKISALEEATAERNKQISKENKAQDVAIANFTTMLSNQKRIIYQLVKDKGELQKGMEAFRESVESQGRKITELEKQLQNMQQNEILPPSSLMAPGINRTPKEKQPEPPQNDPGPITLQQRLLKLKTKHNQRMKLHEEQLLLIPSKNKMEPMAAQNGEVTRKLGPPEEKKPDVLTTKVPSVTMGPQPNQRTSLPEFQQPLDPVIDNIIQMSAHRSSVARDNRPPGETIRPLPSTRIPPHTTAAPRLEEKSTPKLQPLFAMCIPCSFSLTRPRKTMPPSPKA
ncbi:unnamed protein product [Staurois parvus]|uniref:Uncharacterized protein n=1 Tax=Staurois parvus TaxID=386267 RepID=A0ABN9HR73_9NEOB|nr:unnamed protein product [Staurois parvus]